MSDQTTYKYLEMTLYTPHNEYQHTVWRREAQEEGTTLEALASEIKDLWKKLLGKDMEYVAFDFGENQTVIMSNETVARCEIDIYLKEDTDGLPF